MSCASSSSVKSSSGPRLAERRRPEVKAPRGRTGIPASGVRVPPRLRRHVRVAVNYPVLIALLAVGSACAGPGAGVVQQPNPPRDWPAAVAIYADTITLGGDVWVPGVTLHDGERTRVLSPSGVTWLIPDSVVVPVWYRTRAQGTLRVDLTLLPLAGEADTSRVSIDVPLRHDQAVAVLVPDPRPVCTWCAEMVPLVLRRRNGSPASDTLQVSWTPFDISRAR